MHIDRNARLTRHALPLIAILFAVAAPRALAANLPSGDAPFTLAPKDLYDAATNVSPADGESIVVLTEEERFTFDGTGHARHASYLVYKVVNQQGADDWSDVQADWDPWLGERPKLRVRVVAADGAVHELDGATIADKPAGDDGDDLYGDGRSLRAPLPAISPGAVVEELVVWEDHEPFAGAGTVVRNYFGRNVRVERSVLTIDTPAELPLRYVTELLPDLQPRRTEANGLVTTTFERRSIKALEDSEPHLPGDVPAYPAVAFAVGTTWERAAAEYSNIVDRRIEGGDVRALAARLTQDRTGRDDKARAILGWLSREIRYTGVEFGEAAVVPSTPSETLARKYGDCKDKATLLVALLRASGIPAYIALLNIGARLDVPRDLAGTSLFDHAIVQVPATPDAPGDLWIDATADHARLGQLPVDDSGRWALVARVDGGGLVRTPEAQSAENVTAETREIVLAEQGPAKLSEISHPLGSFETGYRDAYVDKKDKDTLKALADYLKGEYLAKGLDRMERTDPSDLDRPFELVLEANSVRRGWTDLDAASAAIDLSGMFRSLPREAKTRPVEAPDEPKKPPRTGDVQLPEPFVADWRYRIVPPPGYRADPVPKDVSLDLGPAKLTQSYAIAPDGAVEAHLRFDTVKRRYTPAELVALRDQVVAITDGEMININFRPLGRVLLDEGKVRESFQSWHALIAQHPKEALHHLQLANALLVAGLGEAARDEARVAVKLEPKSALAQKTLGNILTYDLVGRQFRGGSDYAGAQSALRAAIKLDPEDHDTVGELAILLEHDAAGLRYGPGAKVAQAVEVYRSLTSEQLAAIRLPNNLAYALFYSGDFAGAAKNAATLNPVPKALAVACEAAIDGGAAGIAEARRRATSDEDFHTTTRTAGNMLMAVRRYPEAADLHEAGSGGSDAARTMALVSYLRGAKPHEGAPPGNTPTDAVLRAFGMAVSPEMTLEAWRPLFSRNAWAVNEGRDDSEGDELERSGLARQVRGSLARMGISTEVMLDLMPVLLSKVEGSDETAWRQSLQIPGGKRMSMIVVKEQGQYRILYDGNGRDLSAVGLEVLERAGKGDLEGARVLLDWARDELRLAGGEDPWAGPVLPRIWTRGAPADAATMRLAAAALMAGNRSMARQAVDELGKATASGPPVRDAVSLAVVLGYSTLRDYPKMLEHVEPLATRYPSSARLFQLRIAALNGLDRFADAAALAEKRMADLPDDLDAPRALASNAFAQGHAAEAYERMKRLIDDGRAEAQDYNVTAWWSLFFDRPDGPDIDNGIRATQARSDFATLHTLACLYAEAGKSKEAREVLLQAMDQRGLQDPDDGAAYVLGRLAEQFGEEGIARAYYGRIAESRQKGVGTVFELAKRHGA